MRKLPIALAGVCLFAAGMHGWSKLSAAQGRRPCDLSRASGEFPAPPSAESLGNEKWWTVFHDPGTAATDSHRFAAELRRADCRHARPSGAGPARDYPLQPISGRERRRRRAAASVTRNQFLLPDLRNQRPANWTSRVIWNLDFWGKYRRETEAARANLLATEWGQRAVITSVVSSVATAYFQLRELDLALEISAAHAGFAAGFACA